MILLQWFPTYGSRPKLGREGLAEGREGSAGEKRKIRQMSGNLGKIKVISEHLMGYTVRRAREKSGN